MTKTIFEEMGGTYRQVGDYLLPNITVPAEEKKEIMQAAVKQVVKYIRVRNASSENLNFKVVLFNAEIK